MTHEPNFLYITIDPTNLKTVYSDTFSGVIITDVGYYTDGIGIGGGEDIYHPVSAVITKKYYNKNGTLTTDTPTNIGRYNIRITASLSPSPLTPGVPTSSMIGYFTSYAETNEPYSGKIEIVDTSKALVIDKGIATITIDPESLNHTYNDRSPVVTYTTEPANLKCSVTYTPEGSTSSSVVAPSDAGSHGVVLTIMDRNYKSVAPASGTLSIVNDVNAMTKTLDFKGGLLSPEGKASLADPTGFITNTLLTRLDVPQIAAISTIASIGDCAKSLPDKLIAAIATKLLGIILSYIPGFGIVNLIKEIKEIMEEIQKIIVMINAIRANPLGFLDSVLASTGVYAAVNDQIHALESQFPAISGGVSEVLKDIDNICNKQDYSIFGLPSPGKLKSDPTLRPTAMAPTPMPLFDQTSNNLKTDYDALLVQLKEGMTKDSEKMKQLSDGGDKTAFANYLTMITSVSKLGYSYHDDISKTTDSSKDEILLQKYIGNVKRERTTYSTWDADTLSEFDRRTNRVKLEISRSPDIIRGYFMKNTAVLPGGAQSVGVTTYGPAETDSRTAHEIEIGIQSINGTREGDMGAYGILRSGLTIASSRWPGGSLIALKNPNGSPYNPAGVNPSGVYTVTDTGNMELTYARPDIFTTTPKLYTGTEYVQAFVVSLGTQYGPRYKQAMAAHPNTVSMALNNA